MQTSYARAADSAVLKLPMNSTLPFTSVLHWKQLGDLRTTPW